jgi:hypothetical protein
MRELPLTESNTLGRGLEYGETVSMLDDALDYVSREGVRFPKLSMTRMASITLEVWLSGLKHHLAKVTVEQSTRRFKSYDFRTRKNNPTGDGNCLENSRV